jgi:hypothetical protein
VGEFVLTIRVLCGMQTMDGGGRGYPILVPSTSLFEATINAMPKNLPTPTKKDKPQMSPEVHLNGMPLFAMGWLHLAGGSGGS